MHHRRRVAFPFFLSLLLSLAAVAQDKPAVAMPAIPIDTQVIDYRDGDTALQGFLAMPQGAKAAPAIMVVHEWKGLSDYARGRAEMLARLGYVAFACDMYGKGVFAKDHDEAGKLSGVFFGDRNKMRARAAAGLDVLRQHAAVDKDRLFVMGYCFGGTTALECARAGMPGVRGVASFHGNLTTPQPGKAGDVKARVMVFHGADDQWVGSVPDFETEMRTANADWQFVSFGGAVHSFTVKDAGTDKSRGMAYDEKADRRSWSMLTAFLAECLAN